jgi:hypothetical protein
MEDANIVCIDSSLPKHVNKDDNYKKMFICIVTVYYFVTPKFEIGYLS